MLATTALEQSLSEPSQPRAVTLAWTAGLVLPLAAVAAWRHARRLAAPGIGSNLGHSAASPSAIIALIALFVMPFGYEAGRLVLLGSPMMAEVTLLTALRNLGLGLAAMADRARIREVVGGRQLVPGDRGDVDRRRSRG